MPCSCTARDTLSTVTKFYFLLDHLPNTALSVMALVHLNPTVPTLESVG